jgi:hypothetical protein
MKPPFSIPATVGLLALVLATSGWATQDPAASAETPVEATEPAADPVQRIPHTLKAVEEAKAGKYGKLKPDDRRRLETAERDIQALMQRSPDLGSLNEADRVQLFNSQEAIIAIVDGLKRTQLVCTYVEGTGTRFKTKHCVTRDMAEAAKRAARESTKTAQRDLCIPGAEGRNSCQ